MSLFISQNQAQGTIDQIKMAQAISCVVNPQSAIYISGPITTGRNFIDWYLHHGILLRSDKISYFSRLKLDVIQKNEAAILTLAGAVRNRTNDYVIQPASLLVPEWEQQDYIAFWLSVIDQFSKELILVDGWQYSIGCVTEYTFAKRKDLCIRTQGGVILGVQEGAELVMNAINEVTELAKDDAVLKKLVSGLQQALVEKR